MEEIYTKVSNCFSRETRDLRHSFASYLTMVGVNLKTVQNPSRTQGFENDNEV